MTSGAGRTALICSLMTACITGTGGPRTEATGWLRIGEATVTNFGVTVEPPLRELDAAEVSPVVLDAVRGWAEGRSYDPRCQRVFDGGDVYVVVSPIDCRPGGPMPADFALSSFSQDGEHIHTISTYMDPNFAVEPATWAVAE